MLILDIIDHETLNYIPDILICIPIPTNIQLYQIYWRIIIIRHTSMCSHSIIIR